MVSPAINTTETTVDHSTCHYWPNWDPYRPPAVHSVNGRRISAIRNPATIVNPRRPDGTRATSPWEKEWFRVVNPTYSYVASQPGVYYSWTYDVAEAAALPSLPLWTAPSDMGLFWERVNNTYAVFSPLLEISTSNMAKQNVLQKVSQKKWDLGVTALELRQTAGLVTDLAVGMAEAVGGLMDVKGASRRSVNRFLEQATKKDVYKAASGLGRREIDVLNRVRDRWMQYQFGVRPLLKDVDDAVNLLSERIHSDGLSVLIVAKSGHQGVDTSSSPWFQANFPGLTEQRVRFQEECRVHYSVVYELPTGQVPLYQALGLDNPLSIIHEATRLSWMWDYAVGTGAWLQTFTAARGLLFREGTVSTLRRLSSVAIENRIRPEGSGYNLKGAPTKGFMMEHGHFRRELLTHGVTPAVVPSIKSELGLVQMANSLMALSHILGGKPGLR